MKTKRECQECLARHVKHAVLERNSTLKLLSINSRVYGAEITFAVPWFFFQEHQNLTVFFGKNHPKNFVFFPHLIKHFLTSLECRSLGMTSRCEEVASEILLLQYVLPALLYNFSRRVMSTASLVSYMKNAFLEKKLF